MSGREGKGVNPDVHPACGVVLFACCVGCGLDDEVGWGLESGRVRWRGAGRVEVLVWWLGACAVTAGLLCKGGLSGCGWGREGGTVGWL